ncbi:MAG: hypothetical protein ACK4MV_04230 [Beijerinckiaceae bacterium]
MKLTGTISLAVGRAGRFALGAAALAVAALALGSTIRGPGDGRAPQAPDASPAPAVQAWVDLPAAAPMYGLKDNIFGREPAMYRVRRNVAGGGRIDQMAFGAPGEAAPHFRLTVYRPLDEPVGDVSFWLEMARRAGEAGLALERAPPVAQVMRTRLGPFEVGALSALGAEGSRTCLGFRHQSREPPLIVSGFACLGHGAADPVFAREALACALEAINLVSDDGDAALRAFFDGSEASVCGGGRPAQAGG